MSRFLNRLLALPIDEQNALFAALEARIEANIEQAVEAGVFEVGVETVRADSLIAADRETLYAHPGTGCGHRARRDLRRDRLEPTTAEVALEARRARARPRRQAEAGGQRPLEARRRRPVRDVAHARRRRGAGARAPGAPRDARVDGEAPELDASHWQPGRRGDLARALGARDRGASDAPRVALLARGRAPPPRLGPAAGGEHAGAKALDRRRRRPHRARARRRAGARRARELRPRHRLRHDRGGGVRGGHGPRRRACALANGWRLARRRIMGADRIEIEGPADTDTATLRRMGCTVEIVSWRARAFAPGAQVLDRILERWPLAA